MVVLGVKLCADVLPDQRRTLACFRISFAATPPYSAFSGLLTVVGGHPTSNPIQRNHRRVLFAKNPFGQGDVNKGEMELRSRRRSKTCIILENSFVQSLRHSELQLTQRSSQFDQRSLLSCLVILLFCRRHRVATIDTGIGSQSTLRASQAWSPCIRSLNLFVLNEGPVRHAEYGKVHMSNDL